MSSKSSGSKPSRPSELQLEQLSSRVRVEAGETPAESMSSPAIIPPCQGKELDGFNHSFLFNFRLRVLQTSPFINRNGFRLFVLLVRRDFSSQAEKHKRKKAKDISILLCLSTFCDHRYSQVARTFIRLHSQKDWVGRLSL